MLPKVVSVPEYGHDCSCGTSIDRVGIVNLADLKDPNPSGMCMCGCGLPTGEYYKRVREIGPYYRQWCHYRYRKGHHFRLVGGTDPNPSGLCMCGCGGRTSITLVGRSNERGLAQYPAGSHRRYIAGHSSRHVGPEYIVDDLTGCWIWQLCVHHKWGYGHKGDKGKVRSAHVVYWERIHGPVPKGMELDHLCRRVQCVNPDHLEPVTKAENVRRSPRCILTADNVREIRSMPDADRRVIALRFGVSVGTIKKVRSRESWKDVA
jgi:hypothetical protein